MLRWLIDDQDAVRSALRLDSSEEIPVATSDNPKGALNALIGKSPDLDQKGEYGLLAEIASDVSYERCPQAEETGFKAFRDDVRQEFHSLQE